MRAERKKIKNDGTSKGHSIGIWVALALFFPGVAAVAGATYALLRRRWPDRALAWLVVGVTAPAAVVVVWVTRYLDHWAGVISALISGNAPLVGDVLVLVGWGLAAGPLLGALYWRVRQRAREKSPYAGQDEKHRRQRAEERRAKVVAHRVQAARFTARTEAVRAAVKPFMVPLGDELGPFIGRGGRGDLGGLWQKGGLVRVPTRTDEIRHLVVLGASGMGKTEVTVGSLAEWAMEQGMKVVYLTCKEPAGVSKSAAPRLAAMAEKHGLSVKVLVPGSSPFDPMRGTLEEVSDRLVQIEEWGDSYWSHCANVLITLALELSQERGEPISTLPDLVYSLIHTRLKELAGKSDPRVQQLVAALDDKSTSGALIRYASMALYLRGWVGPPEAGGWSYEDADVIIAELPMSSRPRAGSALMRLMIRDFGAYMVDTSRRPEIDGRKREVLYIVEEVGAVAGDSVIGKEFVEQLERARSAEVKVCIGAQDPLGLGDERAQSALLTNATVLTFQQTVQAGAVAELAGTGRVDEGAALFDPEGAVTAQGSTRRQHALKLNPQWLRELRKGEAYLIHGGAFRYVATTLTESAYTKPAGPAAERMLAQLHGVRRVAVEPATPRREVPPSQRQGDGQVVELPREKG